jgi:hypothetical protein
MKTGDGKMDTGALEQSAIELFLPVMESATVLAAHYSQACGRDCVVAKDMRYGMMYAARNVAGKHIGSLYPEIYEDEEEGEEDEGEEDEEDEESDQDEEEWTEYEGTENEIATKMNECARTWADWIPANPTEAALKSAVDSIGGE